MVIRKLEHRIALFFVTLLAMVMLANLLLVVKSSKQSVIEESQHQLTAGVISFHNLLERDRRQLDSSAKVLASDFGFREAIATQDRETLVDVLKNFGARIGAQAMMAIALDGKVIADANGSSRQADSFPFRKTLDRAVAEGKSADTVRMADGRIYQIVIVPILAPVRIAWVMMGFVVDDAWARQLAGSSGLDVIVAVNEHGAGKVLASSLSSRAEFSLADLDTESSGGQPSTVQIDGQDYHAVSLPLGAESYIVLLRSLAHGKAIQNALERSLALIAAAAVMSFSMGSLWLARRIARPIDLLASAAAHIEQGNYGEDIRITSADEIGRLARSFNNMRSGIAARENKIIRLAYEDVLTGLPNRTRFLEILGACLVGNTGALVILDLDRFGPINNALGHAVGDSLLREIAVRLEQEIGKPNVVARLWGAEFALLLDCADKNKAADCVGKLLTVLRAPMTVEGQQLDIDASFGIALFPKDGADVTTLLRRADLAMHVAKHRQDKIAFGSELEDKPAIEQLSLIGEMRGALEQGEFVVYYQPKLNLTQNRITAAEALIRWRHPKRGMIPPSNFIPFAEQTGFIREITPWLLRQVIQHAAEWHRSGIDVVASANLSTRDLLNHALVTDIKDLLIQFAVPADRVCMEITESALMDDPALALKHLYELSALGVKLSIDDYGSGQASLAYVKMLPVNELKIDRVFVTDVASASKNAAIVRSTILLCRELGLTVVAEGAETAEELGWLRDNECELVQGYVVAKPMPVADFLHWVSNFNQKT